MGLQSRFFLLWCCKIHPQLGVEVLLFFGFYCEVTTVLGLQAAFFLPQRGLDKSPIDKSKNFTNSLGNCIKP